MSNLKAVRAVAAYTLEHALPHLLIIRDVGGDLNRTVTNDVEAVVAELRQNGLLEPGMQLLYYDSTGALDGIAWEDVAHIHFYPMSGPYYAAAGGKIYTYRGTPTGIRLNNGQELSEHDAGGRRMFAMFAPALQRVVDESGYPLGVGQGVPYGPSRTFVIELESSHPGLKCYLTSRLGHRAVDAALVFGDKVRADEALAQVRRDLEFKAPEQLSKGFHERLQAARVIPAPSHLTLLDEP